MVSPVTKPSSESSHLRFLDELRGFAIISVFLFHNLETAFGYDQFPMGARFSRFQFDRGFALLWPVTFGWAGVPIFFFISGFCIHLSYCRNKAEGWCGFFIKRLFRIYPPYVAAIVFFILLFPSARHNLLSLSQTKQYVSHLLLVHNFSASTYYGINASFWSIAVEAQLYLIYPLVIFIARVWGWDRALSVTLSTEILARLGMGIYSSVSQTVAPAWLTGCPFTYWFSWSIGAALVESQSCRIAQRLLGLPYWVYLIAGVSVSFLRLFQPFTFTFFSLTTGSLIKRALEAPTAGPRSPLFCRCTQHIGLISYSIYLLHQPLFYRVFSVEKHLHLPQSVPLITFATGLLFWVPVVALSRLSFRLVERPSAALGRVLARRH